MRRSPGTGRCGAGLGASPASSPALARPRCSSPLILMRGWNAARWRVLAAAQAWWARSMADLLIWANTQATAARAVGRAELSAGLDEPVRSRLQPARPRGLTSPDQSRIPRAPAAPGEPPAKIPDQNRGQAAQR